jgi:hypothetical protein
LPNLEVVFHSLRRERDFEKSERNIGTIFDLYIFIKLKKFFAKYSKYSQSKCSKYSKYLKYSKKSKNSKYSKKEKGNSDTHKLKKRGCGG